MPPRGVKATGTKSSRGGHGHGGKSTAAAAAAPPFSDSDLPIITTPDNVARAARQPPITGATPPLPVAPPRIFAIAQYTPPAFPDRPSSLGEEFPSTPSCSDSEGDTVVNAGSKLRKLPPIIISPVKKKRALQGITKLSDLEVWDKPDEEIIGMCVHLSDKNHIIIIITSNIAEASLRSWTSTVYDHYTVSLERHVTVDNLPSHLHFIFTCRTHPENHTEPQSRARQKSGHGTTTLAKDVTMCQKKQGINHAKSTSAVIPYSEAYYRALIALRCAKQARPINMVLDEDYRMEAVMLRPGIVVPHPTTVHHDLINIYTHMSQHVYNFFAVSFGCISINGAS